MLLDSNIVAGMDILQNGVKNLKRHSIANISDVIRNHIHRDSLSSLGRHHRTRSPSRANFHLKNAHFESVSAAVVHLFQKKKLQENELSSLQENVRNLITTDAGPLIYDFYKYKLTKKGMVILRENIKHETGTSLINKLGEQWDYFYKEILPVLQALLYPVKTKQKCLSIRQVTLLEFRNTVLLKLSLSEALHNLPDNEPVCPAIQQMLLVLQGVHESPCTDRYIQLERMVARVTSSYLGMLGLYNGGSQPDVRSNYKCSNASVKETHSDVTDEEPSNVDHRSKKHHLSTLPSRHSQKRGSGLLHHPLLTAVKEQDRGHIRRYSIATS